jgi:hypothetical protein
VACQHVDEVVPAETHRHNMGDAQRRPVSRYAGVVDHEHRTTGLSGSGDQVSVDTGQAGVDDERRKGAARGQPGSHLLSREALDELDRRSTGVGPRGDGSEPRRPWTAETQHDEAFRGHQSPGVDRGEREAPVGTSRKAVTAGGGGL